MLISKYICKGIYGYLGGYLLDIVSASDGYEFLARDSSFVDTYNFKREQSPYTGRVYYTLPAPKNVGIRAYFRELGVSFTMTLWGMLGKLFLLKGITDSMGAIVSDTANPIELILLGTELAPLTLWASLVVDNYSTLIPQHYNLTLFISS